MFIGYFKRKTYEIPNNFDLRNLNRHIASLNIPDEYAILTSKNIYTVRSSSSSVSDGKTTRI